MNMRIFDAEVLNFLTDRNSLLDSKLISLGVWDRDNSVTVELVFRARAGAEFNQVKLNFECVTEFDFTYGSDYVFGNVEGLKFLMADDGHFYLCLDPDPSGEQPSEGDRDFVKAKKLWAEMDFHA